MWGVISVEGGQFETPSYHVEQVPSKSLMTVAMAACHTLTIIDGALLGDPLDLKVRK